MSKQKLIIRDGHASLNGSEEVFIAPSGSIDILTDQGRILFSITLEDNGQAININSGDTCKIDHLILDDRADIELIASNCFRFKKRIYKDLLAHKESDE